MSESRDLRRRPRPSLARLHVKVRADQLQAIQLFAVERHRGNVSAAIRALIDQISQECSVCARGPHT